MSARELARVGVMSDNFLSKNIRPIILLVLLGIILVEIILRKDISPELKKSRGDRLCILLRRQVF